MILPMKIRSLITLKHSRTTSLSLTRYAVCYAVTTRTFNTPYAYAIFIYERCRHAVSVCLDYSNSLHVFFTDFLAHGQIIAVVLL